MSKGKEYEKKLMFLSIQLLFGNLLFSCYQSECTTEPMVCMLPECDSYKANFFAEGSVLYWHLKVYKTEFASESVFILD